MNKIIILGCGYIGTNLANYIVNNYNDEVYVLGIYNEYNKYLDVKVKFIEKYIEQICKDDADLFKNAIVVDAVGNINATNDTKSSSTLFLQNCSNKVELIKVLSCLKIKKYVFLSSGGTVYNDSRISHKEDEIVNPTNIYALEKVIIENYLKINSLEDINFKYLILRLSNPYGGVVSKNKRQGIIDVAINKIKNDETLELYGELDNVRDYIYIKNLTECIYKISKSTVQNDIFNIGSGEGTSVKEVLRIIEKIYNKKIKFENKKISTLNIGFNILDINKLKKFVKINKIYTVEEGIKLDKNIKI